ncbi:hypothetical protein SEVIR_4G031150v4 [Setaria viridis]
MLSFGAITARLGPKSGSAQPGTGPTLNLQLSKHLLALRRRLSSARSHAAVSASGRKHGSHPGSQVAVLPFPIRCTGLVWGGDSSGLGSIPLAASIKIRRSQLTP